MADVPDPQSGLDESGEWQPVFEGQRPPFRPGHEWAAGPGNERSTKHGAESERRLRPLAQRWLARLDAAARAAAIHADVDDIARERLASTLARAELFEAYLDEHGFEDERGDLRPAVPALGKLDSSIRSQLRELGFTVKSRAEIGLDVAQARNAISEADMREFVVAVFRAIAETVSDRTLAQQALDRVGEIIEAHPVASTALPPAGPEGPA